MINIGTLVRILEPFNSDYKDIYIVEGVIVHDDGQVAYLLQGIGGFDLKFLEIVE